METNTILEQFKDEYNRIKEPCEICGRPGYDYLISERRYEVGKKETTDNE